jgi:hypothetical protein
MTDRADVVRAVQDGGVYDGGLLPSADLDLVREAAAELGDRRVAVVVLPVEEDLPTWRSLWDEMAFDADHDLLLIHDGERWEAKGLGLGSAEVSRVLQAAAPELTTRRGQGLAAALRGLGRAAGIEPVVPGEAGGVDMSWLLGGGAVGAVALGGLGWIISRRMRLASDGERRELQEASAEVERLVAEVVLDADELGAHGRDLQDRAVRLKAEIKAIPADLEANVRLGRLRRLEDEVVALRSRILQSGRREG